MYLTRQTEIAIGILILCGSAPSRMVQIRFLADRVGATKDHAAQVVALLVRNGLLASQRGRAGGVRLAASPETIHLAEVIRMTQPELLRDAAGTHRFHQSGNPGLDAIVEACAAFFARLIDRFTIADLLARHGEGRITCLDCGLMNPAPLMPAEAPAPFSTPRQPNTAASRAAVPGERPMPIESPNRHAQQHL